MAQYEYHTFAFNGLPSAEQMTELGSEGWLLTVMLPVPQGYVVYLARPTKTSEAESIREALRQIREMGKDIKP